MGGPPGGGGQGVVCSNNLFREADEQDVKERGEALAADSAPEVDAPETAVALRMT
jgi:hypothetical protein